MTKRKPVRSDYQQLIVMPSASSPVLDRMVSTVLDMRANPDAIEKAYMARHLVQCTLPHSDPGNVPIWRRTNGNLTLSVRPMLDPKTDMPLYPCGTYPRLLLYWIVTEATRTKSRKLFLGKSLAQFMRQLGLDPYSGGKRGGPKRLHDQMTRLLRATISFEQTFGNGQSWIDMQIGPVAELWWDPAKDEQGDLFQSWLELGEQFYKAVTTRPVPLDPRALRALKKSPMSLDLYSWLAHKTWIAASKREAQLVPWEGLALQMGADYADLNNFKKKVRRSLGDIRKVYEAVKVEETKEGLLVRPSSTPVSPLP
jgi:hypothetical protein